MLLSGSYCNVYEFILYYEHNADIQNVLDSYKKENYININNDNSIQKTSINYQIQNIDLKKVYTYMQEVSKHVKNVPEFSVKTGKRINIDTCNRMLKVYCCQVSGYSYGYGYAYMYE